MSLLVMYSKIFVDVIVDVEALLNFMAANRQYIRQYYRKGAAANDPVGYYTDTKRW